MKKGINMDERERVKLEYVSLRQEIMNSINACDTYKIAMYTVTVALLSVAFAQGKAIFFLLPYVVIFAFQWAISAKNENNVVLAAYIAVFLEEGQGWESNNLELKEKMHNNKTKKLTTPKIINRLIGRISSAQLGFLCSLLCCIYSIPPFFKAVQINECVLPGACVILSVALYVGIRIQTEDVLKLWKKKNEYIKNLRGADNLRSVNEQSRADELISVS